MLKENTSPVLKETHINYQHPITIQDQVKGQVRLSNVSKAKWECAFEILNESRVFANGEQIGYFIDVERKRPVRVTKKIKD